jgi:LPS-assembly lipoprotein
MSSYKIIISLVLCLGLSACGFLPMYGKKPVTQTPTSKTIKISNIPDRDGQYLRNALIDRLYSEGEPVDAAYLLKIEPLGKNITNIGIRKDATSTRGQMEISAKMSLVERTSGKTVLKRDLHSIGAYNQLDNQFATLVSKDSLTGHMLDELADNVVTELGLYFNRASAPAAE